MSDVLKWHHPYSMFVSGPSSSGKTFFVKRFLEYRAEMCDTTFERIIVYYAKWQPSYDELNSGGCAGIIEFREGLPRSADYNDDPRAKLVILDDLMSVPGGKTIDGEMFTWGSHHRNMSVIFIAQNLFHQGLREIPLNAHYIVVFKNPRDENQIGYLARQIFPEAYTDATAEPHSYLFFDLKQTTPEILRVKTHIFPENGALTSVVYLPLLKQKSATVATRSGSVGNGERVIGSVRVIEL